MKRILVTGGAGYIGAHACKALARAGWLPVCFDNLSTGHARAVRFGPLVQADLADRDALAAAFAEHRPEAVLHFAASAEVGAAASDPGGYWRNNLLGALNLVEAALAAGCRRIVQSSTCAVYGDQGAEVLVEEAALAPANAYATSKRAIEDMLGDFAASHGLEHMVFRYFNVAGADPEAEIGEAHDPETHLVPLVLQAAMGRRKALTIHGTDYPTPDGTCIRDYVHVCDLIDAHLRGLERLAAGAPGRRLFNLGTGRGFSVRAVIDTAARVTGRPVPHVEGPRRPGDAVRLVASGARASQALGWRPERSDLETIITDAWRWHTSDVGSPG